MTTLRFKSFQSRILFFFLVLFSVILGATNMLVGLANNANEHEVVGADLKTASKIFLRLMDIRTGQLAETARILSGDYAFKTAFATEDKPTIISALANQQERIGADIMQLVSNERKLIVGTDKRDVSGSPFATPALIDLAEDQGEASALLVIRGETHQIVVVPLLAPTPVAWIVLGFKVNDVVAHDFKRLTDMEVSFFQDVGNGTVRCFASTLPESQRQPLWALFKSGGDGKAVDTAEVPVGGDLFISLKIGIGKTPDGLPAFAVLQRSLTAMMRPYEILETYLVAIGLAGLVIAAIAGIAVSRSVTKPVTALVEGVRRVEKGDFTGRVSVHQEDELGTLANAINQMTLELAEKDKVRSLLGKVVSHDIAEELLKKELELGGELREVTVMFVDICAFTSHAEGKDPKEVLSLLNVCFTRMGEVIEANGGVVDKYIGDAIMAIFGAPIQHEDDADRALSAAVGIEDALEGINAELSKKGLSNLDVGIGVNTDVAVVGNMGSMNRLNYTAIGDGVNVASRLQDLTREKKFGTRIIISQATLLKAKKQYRTRDLGMVSVKGKAQPVAIYGLTGKNSPMAKA